MGKITKVCPHMSVEELRMRLKGTKDRRTAQRLRMILNALVHPRPAEEIALHTGVSIHSGHNWIPAYNRSGREGILGPGTGGRRNQHMSEGQESFFLKPYFKTAETAATCPRAESSLGVCTAGFH
jgi:transposase